MQHSYDDVAREVDDIVDGLGMPVDAGVKKVVTALRLWDFPTDGSCEGHLRRALPYPWVEIYAPEIPDEAAWTAANQAERKRLSDLLEDFYKQATPHYKFDYENIGIFGGFRLVSGAAKRDMKPNAALLKQFREDFDLLADYLIQQHAKAA